MYYQCIRISLTFRFSLLFSRESPFSHLGKFYVTTLDMTFDMSPEVSSMREFRLNILVMY
jgi:hypothetical protein